MINKATNKQSTINQVDNLRHLKAKRQRMANNTEV